MPQYMYNLFCRNVVGKIALYFKIPIAKLVSDNLMGICAL